jgi:hypothetical protein
MDYPYPNACVQKFITCVENKYVNICYYLKAFFDATNLYLA